MVAASEQPHGVQARGRLRGKAAIVTCAARGIGRAAAVAFAAREPTRWASTSLDRSVRRSRSSRRRPRIWWRPGAWSKRPGRAGSRRVSTSAILPRCAPLLRSACGLWPAPHPVRQRRHPDIQTDPRLAGRGLAGHDRRQPDRDLQRHPRGAPHLVRNGGGRIIVTTSTQGRHGTKFGAAHPPPVGRHWLDEIGGARARRAQDHRQRRRSRPHRHTSDATPAALRAGRRRFRFRRSRPRFWKPKRKRGSAPSRRSGSHGSSRRRSRPRSCSSPPTTPSW